MNMPDDTVIISNLPSHSPSGSDYLAVENDSLTGKSTINDVVGASSSVATLNSKIKFTEYTHVTQLGLTTGSATVVAVYRAMVTPGRFVGSNDQFASGDIPLGNGMVLIEKLSVARGDVWFYGKGSTPGDYRMFLGARAYNGNDSNLPTGEWIAEPTRAEVDALTTFMSHGTNISDGVVDGAGSHFGCFNVPSGHTTRVPVLIGGNVANVRFLRLFQINLSQLSSDLAEQTSYTEIVPLNGYTISTMANADGGDTKKLRIRVRQTSTVTSHYFIMPLVACDCYSSTVG